MPRVVATWQDHALLVVPEPDGAGHTALFRSALRRGPRPLGARLGHGLVARLGATCTGRAAAALMAP